MTVFYNAFSQWIVRCASASEIDELSALGIQIQHNINHLDREKRLNDIIFILNIPGNYSPHKEA